MAMLMNTHAVSAAHHSSRWTSQRAMKGSDRIATAIARSGSSGARASSRPRFAARKAAPPPMSRPAHTQARNVVALRRGGGGVGVGVGAMMILFPALCQLPVRLTMLSLCPQVGRMSARLVVGLGPGLPRAERLEGVRGAIGLRAVARRLDVLRDGWAAAAAHELPGEQE